MSLVHSADVDIDLGRGLAHAKEWLENNVFRPGHKTNQALVYGLLYTQGILPRYTLDPGAVDDASGAAAQVDAHDRRSQPVHAAGRTPRRKAKGRPPRRQTARMRKKSR